MVASGMFDKLLVIGWEKNSESDTTGAIVTATDPILDRGVMAGALAGLAIEASEYAAAYGATPRDAARVSVRDRRHACNNPYAHLRKEVTIEDVLNSPVISDPLRLLPNYNWPGYEGPPSLRNLPHIKASHPESAQ